MSATKAAVPARTAPPVGRDCPMLTPGPQAQLKTCVAESKALSREIIGWLGTRDREDKAAWVASSVEAGRVIFQPWTMELLFALAVAGHTRFSELQSMLGISSRTLSDKLQTLREAGLVERIVHDEQPVRIEYHLTKEGVTTAALATPLFTHLNQRQLARQTP